MAFEIAELKSIFDRTSGLCHICHKKLCRNNYGKMGAKGAWEVEHSVPKSAGGTDHLNNLFAACCRCNREKGTLCTRTARRRNGTTKAPLSEKRRKVAQSENTVIGGICGMLAGLVIIGGPVGFWLGLLAGGKIGNSLNPDNSD